MRDPNAPSRSVTAPLGRAVACALVAATLGASGGCSMFLQAGRLMFGDPERSAPFKQATGVDLTEGKHKVLVVATTPTSVKQEMPGVDLEIVDRVSRRLRTRGLDVIPSKDVLNWLDDRGGRWDDPSEIAEAFDVGYIVHIEVDRFTHHEPNSPDLLRGNTAGNVRAYQVKNVGGKRVAMAVFVREFTSVYPTLNPKQSYQVSERIFQEEFLGRVCAQVAQLFYDHRASETVY